MNKNSLKNIIVLKNLPSNIVDEAIIILKPTQKIKKMKIIDNNQKKINSKLTDNLHVISEAEMIVNSYISNLEKKDSNEECNNIIKNKYKRLKKYAFFISFVLFLMILVHLF